MSEGFQIQTKVKQSTNSVSTEYKACPCAQVLSRTQTFCLLLVPWSAFLYDFLPTIDFLLTHPDVHFLSEERKLYNFFTDSWWEL